MGMGWCVSEEHKAGASTIAWENDIKRHSCLRTSTQTQNSKAGGRANGNGGNGSREGGCLGRVIAPAVRDEVGQRRKPPRARLPLRRRPLGQDARRDADLERVRPRDGLTVLFASMRALVHLFHLYMR